MLRGLEHRLPAEEVEEGGGHVERDMADGADATGPHPVRGLLHVRGVVEAVGGHEGPAGLAGEASELAGIGGPGRHRLFDEHVASPAKGLRRVLEVGHVRRSDDHAIRTAVVHLEVVLGDVGQIEPSTDALELRRAEPAGRDQLRLAVLPDVGDVVFAGPPPGPDYRDARLLLHPCHRELPDTAGQSSVSVLPPGTHGRRSQYCRVEPEGAIQEVVICDLGLQGAASINHGGTIMSNQPKKEPNEEVRVKYPHAGQRFVDVDDLLANKGVRQQIERMAELAEASVPRTKEENEAT